LPHSRLYPFICNNVCNNPTYLSATRNNIVKSVRCRQIVAKRPKPIMRSRAYLASLSIIDASRIIPGETNLDRGGQARRYDDERHILRRATRNMRALTRLTTRSPCANFLPRLFSHEPLGSRSFSASAPLGGSFTLTYRANANANICADLAESIFLSPEARRYERYRSRWCEQSCYISSYVEIMVITGAYGVRLTFTWATFMTSKHSCILRFSIIFRM